MEFNTRFRKFFATEQERGSACLDEAKRRRVSRSTSEPLDAMSCFDRLTPGEAVRLTEPRSSWRGVLQSIKMVGAGHIDRQDNSLP